MGVALDWQAVLMPLATGVGVLAYSRAVHAQRGGVVLAGLATALSVGAVVVPKEGGGGEWWQLALASATGPLAYGVARWVRRRSSST